jgi:hypothetical protein
MSYRPLLFFIISCLLAAVAPFAPMRSGVTNEQSTFPGWPIQFEGRRLTQLPLSSREKRFAADFPGRIARFSDGSREIIIRWVERETRALHAASDCFKGLGYSIKPIPARDALGGHHWGGFEARQGDDALRIYERIYDSADKESWSDVSSWYWQATMGGTSGGWWAVTVAERL